jgi:hypothetical protein
MIVEMFDKGLRPDNFEEAYRLGELGSGQWYEEAKSLWDIIRAYQPRRLAEVGRHMAGNSFLMACAAPRLERFLSIDILRYPDTDRALSNWLARHGIAHELVQADSRDYQPAEDMDFVYIDGEHTGEAVKADIAAWKDRTTLIGFHDFADKGTVNAHRHLYPDLIAAVQEAQQKYGWEQVGVRGRSEIVFRTRR